MDYLKPLFKEKIGVDLEEFLANECFSASDWEFKLSYKFYENDLDTYFKKYSGLRRFNEISVPTLVFFCEDDMIVNRSVVQPETLIENPNVIVSWTKYGSHLCSHEHFVTTK